jgi:hypothetical protein
MSVDRRHDVQANAGGVGSPNILQERLVGFGAREGSYQQRMVSMIADGTSQILRHARARLLHRDADRRQLRRGGRLAVEKLAS